MNQIKTKLFIGLLATLTALLVMIGTYLGWAKFVEMSWLSYQNLPFPLMHVAYAGEVVPLEVERCSTRETTEVYVTTHTLERLNKEEKVVGEPQLLPDALVSIEPGCHRTISMVNKLPYDTKPGSYRLSGVAIIPMQVGQRRVAWYSEPFKVEKPRFNPPIAVLPIPVPVMPQSYTVTP